MKRNQLPTSPSTRRRASSAVVAGLGAASVAVALMSGCLERPVAGIEPRTTNVFVDRIQQNAVDKIDLLFMLDNSRSMADKQTLLAAAVPDLVNRLTNPRCQQQDPDDANGMLQQDPQPANADADCDAGFKREFPPIADIHIGVLTSSLGGHGADACSAAMGTQFNPQMVDMAHLIGPGVGTGRNWAATPAFLDWGADPNISSFTAMVQGAGENGCGFEASLEAWYRFLMDPEPYASIALEPCGNAGGQCAVPSEAVDETVLAQRAAFLRPDSLVAIIMLTDENDCSIIDGSQNYLAAKTNFNLPKSTSACDTNPNDPCCHSCGMKPVSGCTAPVDDPKCTGPNGPGTATHSQDSDADNVRCWQQKRRFGVDFLYPVQRYVNALSQSQLCVANNDLSGVADCADADLFANPLYSDLTGEGTGSRTPDGGLVFFAGIVGVPWDLISEDSDPDDPEKLVYKNAQSIDWGVILGTPETSPPIAPSNPIMLESRDARQGLLGVGTGSVDLDIQANGHEWIPSTSPGDLQYACIFELTEARDCSQPDAVACDCEPQELDRGSNNPLCQADDGSYSTTQRFGKAFPGTRHLEVLRGYGANSIVASICPRNATDQSRPDYGYRPAVDTIITRLADALQVRCLDREVAVTGSEENGDIDIACTLVEARPGLGSACNCASPGRDFSAPEVLPVVKEQLAEQGRCEGDPGCENFCLCDITPAGGDFNNSGYTECLNVDESTAPGWCYVDPYNGRGNIDLIPEDCRLAEPRLLKFSDPNNDLPANGSTVFIACLGANTE
ncbi:MAG: hypothetical protein HRU17_10015 [Polyangiaceae bacterium]|nr:hypothetical protein [Polyangiaceae bacterium]